MTTQEKKYKAYEEVILKYKHLENYCTIEVTGLDDDNIYYHIYFKINDDVHIRSQSDVGTNEGIYGLTFVITQPDYISIEINEELLNAIIIGYTTNKNMVMLALTTLGNIRNHINKLNSYTSDYINNLLIGNSIKETTQCFINELHVTSMAIDFLKKQQNG